MLIVAIAGVIGARVYHVLERPKDLLADPVGMIFSRSGFAWAGGLLAGVAALFWLSRRYRLSVATIFDVAAPAAALGYAVGRVGCLISGDGDYGIPTSLPWGMSFPHGLVPTMDRVHPTPIYEFLAGVLIFYMLWKLGSRSLQQPRPEGEIIGHYFVWTGLARFLVEFIRINPRSFLGILSNAQFVAILSVVAGLVILIAARRRFKATRQEHRILQHSERAGSVTQPEYHQATPECPHPQRWRMFDSMTAEVEVLQFLRSLVITLKPNLVVETGTFMGVSSLWIAEGLQFNGFGKLITYENDPLLFEKARQKIAGSGLASWIECRNHSSLEGSIPGCIDLFFSDSDLQVREEEVRHYLPQISPNGIILMHDASSHLKTVREAALRLEGEGLLSVLLLPTPRGLVMAQKRDGRK